LNTASADLGTVIEKNYVMSISPSLSRNVLKLMYMTPEVLGSTAGVLASLAIGDPWRERLWRQKLRFFPLRKACL
jgi:hypothetical protein